MEKNISGILTIVAVICLVLVGLAYGTGYNMGIGDTKTITEIEYQNISVPEIEYIEEPSVLEKAIDTFMQSVDDEEDEAGNDINVLGNYNFDEVSKIKVYDEYSVEYDDEMTTVNFSIRLQFDDGDDRVKDSYDVTVIYEDDEDTEVFVA